MAKRKFTIKKMAKAITEANGLMSYAAKKLNCDRSTVEDYIERFPACKTAWLEAREKFVDVSESKLMECVQDKQPWAVALTLKTLGKKRGFVEKMEVEQSGTVNSNVSVNFVFPDSDGMIHEPKPKG
jgi:hypothetical protein